MTISFPNMSWWQIKNIAEQLPDNLAFNPIDIGKDATEEIVLNYFKINFGLSLHPWESKQMQAERLRHECEEGRNR